MEVFLNQLKETEKPDYNAKMWMCLPLLQRVVLGKIILWVRLLMNHPEILPDFREKRLVVSLW